MSKIIKITPECREQILREFIETLHSAKIADGRINYTKNFGYIDRKATLYFTEIAWAKMQTLIREFDKEVAWHCIAHRGEDFSKDEYHITDVLVYPQVVTGATVETDQSQYETWLYNWDDDVFNNIRAQGHSHVNMSTFPSSVDLSHQERILEQMGDDMFYIFMIYNKKGDKTIKIYDMKKNILFETFDIEVKIKDENPELSAFLKGAKEMVRDKIATPPSQSKSLVPVGNTEKATETTKPFGNNNKFGYNHKRKGKRKGKRHTTTTHSTNTTCSETQISLFGDDLSDPCGTIL